MKDNTDGKGVLEQIEDANRLDKYELLTADKLQAVINALSKARVNDRD